MKRSTISWRHLTWLPLTIGLLASMPSAASAQIYLPPLGGAGGGQFKTPCAPGKILSGVELRVADDVDAMRPVCVTPYGPQRTGDEVVPAAWNGGSGGVRVERLLCPAAKPVVLGLSIGVEGEKTYIVNNVYLFCGLVTTDNQALEQYPSAIFDGPGYTPPDKFFDLSEGSNHQTISESCPAGQVAVGVHGRSGIWLDAMGLICAAPQFSKPPVALGRPGPAQPGPSRTICQAAQDARANNSPAAAGLERQCQAASLPKPLSPALKQVTLIPAPKPVPAKPGLPSACQLAADLRAHGLPTGDLDAQCRAAQDEAGKP